MVFLSHAHVLILLFFSNYVIINFIRCGFYYDYIIAKKKPSSLLYVPKFRRIRVL